MGLGRFGGGVSVARWLVEQGADVLVTDLDPPEKLGDSLRAIDDLVRAGSITLRLGGHHVSDFTDTDLVIANPAVPKPWENRYLRAAQAAGVPITTEIRLVIERLPAGACTIGITGSVGKSTTSAMIAHILREAGRATLFGGNIGGSLLPALASSRASHVVLELSSAMLHWLERDAGVPGAPGWSPDIAVVTNINPNHLDWHGDFAHYERSKQQILRDQPRDARAVLLDALASWRLRDDERTAIISASDHADLPPLSIPGRHNRLNASFAVRTAVFAGIDGDEAARAVASFPGLPDRLQFLGVFTVPDGRAVRAYNDSKSTTPDATRLALDAMDEDPALGARRVRLICGGYDKKIDLDPLARAAARCAAAYTIGATGPGLADLVARHGGMVRSCGVLADAVMHALREARSGDALLLSPGCASWDQFTNYEERGREFARLVAAACARSAASVTP